MLALSAVLVIAMTANTVSAQEREKDIEDVSLEALLNQKVSAATKHEQSSRQAPASVTVISAEEIRRFGYQTVAEVLEAVHGFYGSTDLEAPSIGVRGFGQPSDLNSRMLVLVDGHPFNESSTNWAFLDFRLGVDITLVDRIEVVRGPGSALYGTGAMMAVVNVVTKEPDDLNGVEVTGSAGSYGFREGHVSVGKSVLNDYGIVAAATWGAVEGHDIYFEDLDFENLNGGVAEQQDWQDYYGVSLAGTVGAFTLRARQMSYAGGDPTGSFQTVFNHDAAEQRIDIGVLEALYRKRLGTSTHLSLGAHLNRAKQEKTMPMRSETGVVITEDLGESVWTGLVGDFRWDVSPVHRIVTGGEIKSAFIDYTRWAPGKSVDESTYTFTQAAAFVQDEYGLLRNLTATAGIRVDYYSQSGASVSPRFALVYHPRRATTLKALYGHAFRSPTVIELHWEQREINFVSNPDLIPEQMRTVEVVLEQQVGEGSAATLSVYRYDMTDLIEITFNGADRSIQYQNNGEVEAVGAELSMRTRTHSGILGYGSYSFQRARHVGGGERLANSPEHMVKAGISLPLYRQTSAGVEFRYESDRETVFRTLTDSYWLVDGIVRSSLLLDGHIDVTASVRNLLNVEYSLPGSPEHRQLDLAQYGRRFVFEIRYHF